MKRTRFFPYQEKLGGRMIEVSQVCSGALAAGFGAIWNKAMGQS